MAQSFDVFLNFKGDCREALDFYADVFNTKPEGLMTYGDAPPSEGYAAPAADKDRIMYYMMRIYGSNIWQISYFQPQIG